jgi:hypothetical protein
MRFEEPEAFRMTQFTKKFVALLVVDAITILGAVALLLRSFWQPAMAIMAALFVANVFLIPSALRAKRDESQALDRGRSKLWFWGFALLAAAFVRLAFFLQSGFSWPGLAGVIAGVLLGTLFLFIAKKSKEVPH